MSEPLNDVKTVDAPSASADATAKGGMDDSAASSSASDASNAGASNLSLSDYLKENVEGMKEETSPAKEDEDKGSVEALEEETPAEKKDEGEEKEKEDEGEKEAPESDEESEKEVAELEAGKPVPYDRFKEVNDKFRAVEADFQSVKPMVENFQQIQSFCQANAITGEQFTAMLETQAMLNTDPAKALERLVPIVESLQGFVGNKLPADLQTKVDEGKMEVDDAREMAKLRAQSQFGEKKTQHTLKQQQQREAAQAQRQMADSLVTWETTKAKLDPDYAKGSPKWDMVQDTFIAMLHAVDAQGNYKNPVKVANDAVTLMDKAYEVVAQRLGKSNGKKPATRKVLSSNGSSSTSTKVTRPEDAKTMQEAINAQLALSGR